jgi:hypothetical protein
MLENIAYCITDMSIQCEMLDHILSRICQLDLPSNRHRSQPSCISALRGLAPCFPSGSAWGVLLHASRQWGDASPRWWGPPGLFSGASKVRSRSAIIAEMIRCYTCYYGPVHPEYGFAPWLFETLAHFQSTVRLTKTFMIASHRGPSLTAPFRQYSGSPLHLRRYRWTGVEKLVRSTRIALAPATKNAGSMGLLMMMVMIVVTRIMVIITATNTIIHIYIYIHTHVCVHVHTYIYIYTHTYYTHLDTYILIMTIAPWCY